MSKMQEAWLAECRKFNLDPAYNKTWKEKFEAGYQAAIADVKAGGPVCIGHEFIDGKSGPVIWIDGYPSVGEELFRLPEDV